MRGSRTARRALALAGIVALGLGSMACAPKRSPSGPAATPPPLDLRGARVMLVPALAGSPDQVDPELAFWLEDRAPETEWILPGKLQAVADRTPQWRLKLRNVPRTVVDLGHGNRRLADPLYGNLRQLAAVLDAGYALVPMDVRTGTNAGGSVAVITAAFVDVRGGFVVWLGTVEGEGAALAAAVTDAASKLARSLSP